MAKRAILVGGGIGGLAAAIALRRAGVEALVFEQQTDLRRTQVGGGIHMWTNAMRALRELGLHERVRELGASVDRTEYRTARGRLLGSWPIAEIGREHRLPDVGITRGELQQVLVEAQEESSVRPGMVCTGFEHDADGVRVRFADGSEERADLLVGADGLRSAIRARLLGERPPRYAGYAQMQALADGGPELLAPGLERVVFGRGDRAVLHHVGGGKLFWAGAVYGPEGSAGDGSSKKELLLDRFRGWEHPVEAAIEATPEEQIVAFDIYDRPPAPRWGEGRVTLLGDAAHPMTTNLSQGGCQTLEDAVVLARSLRDGESVEEALRAYEAARIPRTSALVKRSRAIARMGGMRNPLACRARDGMLRLTLDTVALREHRKLVAEAP